MNNHSDDLSALSSLFCDKIFFFLLLLLPFFLHFFNVLQQNSNDGIHLMVFPCSLFFPIDRWILSDWSSCSATCGDGIQTRDLTCKQEISATLTMRVNEAACLNAAPTLPRVRSCNLGACAKWQASEWSKVSRSMIYDLRSVET